MSGFERLCDPQTRNTLKASLDALAGCESRACAGCVVCDTAKENITRIDGYVRDAIVEVTQ